MNNQSVLKGIGFGLVTAFIWGLWPAASGLGIKNSLNSWDLAVIRVSVASLLLFPFVLRQGFGKIGWKMSLVMMLGAGFPYAVITASGMNYAPAGHAGVLAPSAMMAGTMILSWIMFGDKPGPWRIFGFFLILAGVALIGWTSFEAGNADSWKGDLLYCLGGLFWAIYTVSIRKTGADSLHATGLVAVLSLVICVPPWLLFGESNLMNVPMNDILVQIFFQGILSAVLALVFFTKTVTLLGPVRGALFAALVPVVALLFAIPMLNEIPGKYEWAGMGLVTTGMLAALGFFRLLLGRPQPATKTTG